MTARPPVSETIKKAMELGDISEAELARTTKLPQATINKILHRLTKDPRLSTIVVIAEALNVSITQLAGIDPLPRNAEERQRSQKNFIPVIEWTDALAYSSDVDYPCHFKKWLAVDTEQNENRYFALQTTSSMAPRFRENSLIIVEPTQFCRDDGRVAVVSFNNAEPTLRRVMKDGADLFFRKLHPEAGEKALKLGNADRILGVVVETRMPER